MPIKQVTEKIKNFNSFKDYDVEEFSKFGGDADRITNNLNDEDIKTTQLRKFFAAIKNIELDYKKDENWDNVKTQFYLLMPQVAYAKGRKLISADFYKLLEVSMNKIKDFSDFSRFVQFLEAIIAFHKANNG